MSLSIVGGTEIITEDIAFNANSTCILFLARFLFTGIRYPGSYVLIRSRVKYVEIEQREADLIVNMNSKMKIEGERTLEMEDSKRKQKPTKP